MPTFSFLSNPNNSQLSQIITLYRQAEWWGRSLPDDPELMARIINGSHCFVIATEENEVIGMGRAISDRASDAYIQDLTIKEPFRNKGYGKHIVLMLLRQLKEDNMEWIGLIAEPGSYPFYKKLGFLQMKNSLPVLLKNNEI